MPVLYGVFLYMGFTALPGLQVSVVLLHSQIYSLIFTKILLFRVLIRFYM